jgi:hypothetical protein
MKKRQIFLMFEVIAAIIAYYVLSSIVKNNLVLLGIVLIAGALIIVARSMFTHNDAFEFEMNMNPEVYFEKIKKFEVKDKNKYNTLLAYGLSYTGEMERSMEVHKMIVYGDIKTSANLRYQYYVTKLHLLYNNKDEVEYKKIYEEAKSYGVFRKVEVPEEVFEVHLLSLKEENEVVEEILLQIIPQIRKRILVIELEYILAKTYYNLNKIEDCKAVCEFVMKKNHQTVHTKLCSELFKKIA